MLKRSPVLAVYYSVTMSLSHAPTSIKKCSDRMNFVRHSNKVVNLLVVIEVCSQNSLGYRDANRQNVTACEVVILCKSRCEQLWTFEKLL